MSEPTWSTVSFVKDTPENVRRFVSYHLGLGARRMQIFFDDPLDPCIEMLAGLEQVTTVACSPEFWLEHLGSSEIALHGVRQNTATTLGYARATEDWVLNLDADEFLHLGAVPVTTFLSEVPPGVNVIRFRPAESVFVDDPQGREHFRLPIDRKSVTEVHGDFGVNTKRRLGFFGHLDGKSLIRSGLEGVRLRQHWPEDESRQVLLDLDFQALPDMCILHQNAETFEMWRGKLDFRLSTNSIPGMLRGVLRSLLVEGDEAGIRDVYDKIFSLSEDALTKMQDRNLLFALERPLNRFEASYF